MAQLHVDDPEKMLEKIQELPQQFEQSWADVWTKDLSPPASVNKIVYLGMGGSGIAGRLLKDLAADQLPLPFEIWSDYRLPIFADDKTLVLAVSYSGETEEVLDGVKVALERRCPIVVISRGGTLGELAKKHNLLFIPIAYESQPRLALGWLYGSLLVLCAKWKFISLEESDYFRALKDFKEVVSSKQFLNKAADLALNLANKIPLVFAASPLAAVAYRWQTDFNENAKTLAQSAFLPELCHNLISGWKLPNPDKTALVYLQSSFSFSRNIALGQIVEKICQEENLPLIPISVKANHPLTEQWLLTYLGLLISYYLAGINGVDPTAIPMVERIKQGLASL